MNYIEKTWNGTAWVTSFSQTDVLTYNANNEITSDATPSSAYSPQTLTTYAYTSNNLLASYLSKYENPMFGWANSGNVFYYYNSNNMITDYEVYGWVPLGGPNPANGQWTLEEQTTYTYNTNNLVTTKQDFVNYGTSTLATYTYDANNNLTNILVQVPNDTNWVNGYQIAYTYDANNLKTSYTRKNFNSAGTKIVSGDSTVYYFNAVTGINQIKNSIAKISVYPNPNNGIFVIEPQNTLYNVRCTLYDINGKLVLSQTINGKTSIDAGSLNEGVYNICLTSSEGAVNKRLVIIR